MNANQLSSLSAYSDPRAVELFTWLFNHYKGDARRMAGALQIHSANVSKIYAGTYGSIEQMLDRVEAHKARMDRLLVADFVESETAKNIFELLDRTQKLGTMALIQGPSRRGKTHAVKEWMRRKADGAGKVYYVDVPPEKSSRPLIFEIARALGVARSGPRYAMVERIADRLTSRDVLIFDEAARLLKYNDPTDALEVIRRFHDQQGCGVVFCATNWFKSEVEGGRLAVYLEQLVGRLEDQLVIPQRVSRAEVRAFLSEHTSGAPSAEMVKIGCEIVRAQGKLASLSRHINDALLLARDMGQPFITAEHLRAAGLARQNAGIWAEPDPR